PGLRPAGAARLGVPGTDGLPRPARRPPRRHRTEPARRPTRGAGDAGRNPARGRVPASPPRLEPRRTGGRSDSRTKALRDAVVLRQRRERRGDLGYRGRVATAGNGGSPGAAAHGRGGRAGGAGPRRAGVDRGRGAQYHLRSGGEEVPREAVAIRHGYEVTVRRTPYGVTRTVEP